MHWIHIQASNIIKYGIFFSKTEEGILSITAVGLVGQLVQFISCEDISPVLETIGCSAICASRSWRTIIRWIGQLDKKFVVLHIKVFFHIIVLNSLFIPPCSSSESVFVIDIELMSMHANGTGDYPRSFTKCLERWSSSEVVLSATGENDIMHWMSLDLRSLVLDKRELHFLEYLKREEK